MEAAWEIVKKLPELLNEWGTFSYALLIVLLLFGAAALVYVRLHRTRGAPRS